MRRTPAQLLLFLVFLYVLTPTTSTTIANCYIYSTSGTSCSLCNAGFYVTNSGGSCTAHDCSAMSRCSLCDSTSTCLTCNFGYQLNAPRSACTQITCADSSCNLCASASANQCYSCAVSYYVTNSHSCDLCSTNMAQCKVCSYASGNLQCDTCMSGYYTATATSCATCSSGQTNCVNCDSAGTGTLWCWDCVSTHFISNYAAGTCALCSVGVANCLTCQ